MGPGDLGTVEIGGYSYPNPIGMSVHINDAELVLEVAKIPDLPEINELTLESHQHDAAGKCLISETDLQVYEQVTNAGRCLALDKARAYLQAAGLDIADRPISVEPAIIDAAGNYTKWHVLAPIIVIADQEKK